MTKALHYSHASFKGRIGVARRDITPPVGILAANWGAAKEQTATSVHRPLNLVAVAFQSETGGDPLVLVGVDLIGGGRPDNPLVSGICEAHDLDPGRVMVAYGHTHAGPSSRGYHDRPGSELIPPYNEKLVSAGRDAVGEALASAAPAVLQWRTGACHLAVNRDLRDPDQERLITGFNPEGPADTTLLVGRICGPGGAVRAVLVNYACHGTTLAWDNHAISPDWVGGMRDIVESQTGGAPCLFMQGASGELAPRDQYTGDTDVADRNGREVGYACLSTLEGMLPPGCGFEYSGVMESGAPLATWKASPAESDSTLVGVCEMVELPVKQDLPTLEALQGQLEGEPEHFARERLRRKIRIRERIGDADRFAVPLWIWRIGDALLVGQTCETYSQFQQALRARFPGHAVAVMNLVNGSIGYLPPRDLYQEDAYAVWQTPFASGSLERVTEAAMATLERLVKE